MIEFFFETDIRRLGHTRPPQTWGMVGRITADQEKRAEVAVAGHGGTAGSDGTVRACEVSSYLNLLRFFLNHRRFMRSRIIEGNGGSPRELMTGQGHQH